MANDAGSPLGFNFNWGDEPPKHRPDVAPIAGPIWPVVPIKAVAGDFVVPLRIDDTRPREWIEHCYENCLVADMWAQQNSIPILVGGSALLVTKPCVIVGTGPSAIPLLPEIKKRYDEGEEIIAVKGAHDWLMKNGIVPRAANCSEARQDRAKTFRRRDKRVLYMLATQMHPDTWEYMHGYKLLLYHVRIGIHQQERPGWENVFLVPGSCTTGLVTMIMMYLFGRRNLHLYGFDSSIPAASLIDRAFRRRTMKLDGSPTPKGKTVLEVAVGDERFDTTAELVQQAIDLQPMLERMPGVIVHAYGRGYFQAVLAEGKRLGWPV